MGGYIVKARVYSTVQNSTLPIPATPLPRNSPGYWHPPPCSHYPDYGPPMFPPCFPREAPPDCLKHAAIAGVGKLNVGENGPGLFCSAETHRCIGDGANPCGNCLVNNNLFMLSNSAYNSDGSSRTIDRNAHIYPLNDVAASITIAALG